MPVVSNSKLNFTIVLKSGLIFSNGEPLTIDDVIFSFRVAMTPAIDNVQYRDFYKFNTNDPSDYIANSSLTKINELTLQINLLKYFPFPLNLFNVGLIPQETFQTRYDRCIEGLIIDCNWNNPDGRDVISAGPYMLESINNEPVSVIANPNYYSSKIVNIDRIVFQKIDYKMTAFTELANGNIDILDSRYTPLLNDLSTITGIQESFVGDPYNQEFSLNHLNPYFGTGELISGNENANPIERYEDAQIVRKAMSHLVDRSFTANHIYGGLAEPISTTMPSISIGWDESLIPLEFSVQKAKEYMETVGFNYTTLGIPDPDGSYEKSFFHITMLWPNSSGLRGQWVNNFILELPKIGISVTEVATG